MRGWCEELTSSPFPLFPSNIFSEFLEMASNTVMLGALRNGIEFRSFFSHVANCNNAGALISSLSTHAPLTLLIISYSFRSGKPSGSESAIEGISRDTPGAIYNPDLERCSRSAPTIRLPSTDRFPVTFKAPGTPGPGHCLVPSSATWGRGHGHRAVAWNGPETFTDSQWCR